jgi:hypothetical protein
MNKESELEKSVPRLRALRGTAGLEVFEFFSYDPLFILNRDTRDDIPYQSKSCGFLWQDTGVFPLEKKY